MKRTAYHLSIAAITFFVGLSNTWLTSKLFVPRLLAPDIRLEAMSDTPTRAPSRFTPTFRACGPGYVQGYELPDGQTMAEGSMGYISPRKTSAEFKKTLDSASRIVEHVPQYTNRFGEVGKRTVAIFPPGKDGGGVARIFWYDGGRYFLFIEAPSLEIALEFEKANAYAY
jgi:hypothetical protein